MAKGDGWAVQRYVCPNCKRKGLMYESNNKWLCMYRCSVPFPKTEDVKTVNPILLTEEPHWKNRKK